MTVSFQLFRCPMRCSRFSIRIRAVFLSTTGFFPAGRNCYAIRSFGLFFLQEIRYNTGIIDRKEEKIFREVSL